MEPIAFVEVLDRRGGVRSRVPLWELPATIGRAYSNSLILDDRFACPRHARIVYDDEGWLALEDLGSVNGIYEPGHRERVERVVVRSGTVVRVGHTRLRFVHPETTVPGAVADDSADPEMERFARSRRYAVAVLGVLTAWLALSAYLASFAGNTAAEVIGIVIVVPLMLALWAGGWAVASRIVLQRFEFGPHLAVVCTVALVGAIYGEASSYLLFLFPLKGLAGALVVLGLVVGMLLIYGHLLFASTLTRGRRVAWSVGVVLVLFALGGLVGLAVEEEFSEFTEDPGTLKPVAGSLIPAGPADDYIASLEKLKAQVDEVAARE